ncbi:MAG: hypothetical protein QG637_1015, partial [Chloroflexota bacterium]|nr:hypothetical protein [Chloroflexota bacterium]
FRPIPWGRLYRYYLPLDAIEQGELAGYGSTWRGLPDDFPNAAPLAQPRSAVKGALDQVVLRLYGSQAMYDCPTPRPPVAGRAAPPLLGLPRDGFARELEALAQRHRRVWLVHAGTPVPEVAELLTHMFRVDDRAFANSRTNMNLYLLLPASPVRDQRPPAIEQPADVIFGGQVRLVGYDVGRPLTPESALPVTLYWQPVTPLARRYKYILRLVSDGAGVSPQMLAQTETEPYSGLLPTTQWPAGATIVEYTGVPTSAGATPGKAYLTLQVYDAETLQKLPVTQTGSMERGRDHDAVILSIGR